MQRRQRWHSSVGAAAKEDKKRKDFGCSGANGGTPPSGPLPKKTKKEKILDAAAPTVALLRRGRCQRRQKKKRFWMQRRQRWPYSVGAAAREDKKRKDFGCSGANGGPTP